MTAYDHQVGPADQDACERVRGRLEELLRNELDALSCARDEGHLEGCRECAGEYRELERVLGLVRDYARVDALELAHARQGLEARLATLERPVRQISWLRQAAPILGTAAAAVVALAALEFGARYAGPWLSPSTTLSRDLNYQLPALEHWPELSIDGLRALSSGRN